MDDISIRSEPAPIASVVMAVYNENPKLLEVAVRSVLNQSFRDFEFVIVDDGSTLQETLTTLDRLEAEDARIRLFKETHRGVTKTSNFGLAQARGEFVLRHDSDDWSEPNRFERQIKYLREHPDIALVGSYTLTHQEHGTPLWVWTFPTSPEEIARILPVRNTFCNGSVCFRKREMDAIGRYREELAYSLDYDCYWRMSDRYRVANLPETLYHYRFTRKSISTSKSQEQKRCVVIAKNLAMMRQNGGVEDVPLAIRQADIWIQENRTVDLLQHADHTMLSGAHAASLMLYVRLLWLKPLSGRAWAKLCRWLLFVALPPIRQTLFQGDFRMRQ
jgi:glycosyltransferase involved in cell wall biosynthesis